MKFKLDFQVEMLVQVRVELQLGSASEVFKLN